MKHKMRVNDVLRSFETIYPIDHISFHGLSYLIEDPAPQNSHSSTNAFGHADTNTTSFDSIPVAPQFLDIQGMNRIINIYRNYKILMREASQTPKLTYHYRGKEIIFRCDSYDEGMIIHITDPISKQAINDIVSFDLRGAAVMELIDDHIDSMGSPNSTTV